MKYLLAPLLIGLLLNTQSCRQKHAGPARILRKQYQFAGESRCDTTTSKGVSVQVSYVLLADDEPNARQINARLSQLASNSILDWLDSTVVASQPDARTDLAKAASLFADDYQTMLEDMDGIGGCWELNTTVDTLFTDFNVLTFKTNAYAYTGGAHPNANVSLYTFGRRTGQELGLADMISDTTALVNVVEKAFRRQQQLLPGQNLEEQGYFLRNGAFFLPANIAPGRKGMIFHYNPYEIAAYAVGPIEVIVPYEKLNGILRKELL